MFERNYYYLVAGLPDIILDQKKLTFGTEEFKNELKYHLHPDDYHLVELLFLPADNNNLLNLLLKRARPFDESGKYTRDELEAEIKDTSVTPGYMQKFINAFKSEMPVFEQLSWEDQLTWLYYDHVKNCGNGFLRDWFEFDLNIKNIVAGMTIRKHKLKGEYLIGDNPVVQAVNKSSLRDFGLGNDVEYMEKLISIQDTGNLLERERAMDMLRWDFIDNLNTFNYFTIEVLLGYVIKIRMVQRWLEMDVETGKKMFRKLIDDLEGSYEFPDEFNIADRRKSR